MSLNLRCILLINSRCFHTSPACFTTKQNLELNKIELKHLKTRIEKNKSNLKPKHYYQDIFKINNKNDLAKALIDSEVYHEEGKLIGLVKPYGISRYKKNDDEQKSTMASALNLSGYVSLTSIEEALPLLREYYGAKNLDVVFTPERYTSGILLLGYKPKVNEFVKKCFRRSLGLKKPHQTYWAVVQGLTVPETTAERVCTDYQYVQNIGSLVPIIKKEFSKNSTKHSRVKSNIVEHVVLGHHKENDVSLVEVNVINDSHNFIRVWLAHCCSPVLGDRLFGGRVRMVMGKRIPMNPNNYSSYQPPDMSPKLLEKLNLLPGQVEIIPPHIHLAKLTLKGSKDKPDKIITASPPDYFNWTCTQLSLMSEENEKTSGPIVINDIHDIEKDMEDDEIFTE